MSYGRFADFYDGLTGNADYAGRAEYILGLCRRFDHDTGLTLDLACGTGSLTVELFRRGVDVYGIDASQQMLSVASQKASDNDCDILFLCQKMQSLDLYGTIDTCVCTLDSINHLRDSDEVKRAFERVSLFMNPGGLFIFDANTVYKHEKVLSDNAFVFDTDSVYCVWQNTPLPECTVKIDLDFFVPQKDGYRRESESFCERAYPTEVLTDALTDSGFTVVAVYDDMSFDEPSGVSQRLYYVAKKQ